MACVWATAPPGNGFLSFQELVQHVLPKDYSGETWVEAADRRAEAEQRQREGKFQPVLEKWPVSMKHARCVHPVLYSASSRAAAHSCRGC